MLRLVTEIMKPFLKNYLLQNKNRFSFSKNRKNLFVLGVLFIFLSSQAQIANYVNNPSFELSSPSASLSIYNAIKFWGALDTSKSAYISVGTLPPFSNAPACNFGYQNPRSGNNFIGTNFYCNNCSRGYPRNRLKQILKANTVYCVKYSLVNTNNSVFGINSFGAFFGSSSIDTITKCNIALTYLTPQVQHQSTIITDTLLWSPITGTFTAVGDEKYMVIGNFKSEASTNILLINPTYLPSQVCDIYIDDVSLVELDLPAFAGRDTFFLPGGSVFIGREPDVGIDEACIWYKLPDMTTAIDTVAGLWVTPVGTTTYVVRQQLWCGGVKWDTVVVHESALGLRDEGSSFDSAQDALAEPGLNFFLKSSGRLPKSLDNRATSLTNSLSPVLRHSSFRRSYTIPPSKRAF